MKRATTRSDTDRLHKALEELEARKWEDVIDSEREIIVAVQIKHFWVERRELLKAGIDQPNSRKEMARRDSPLTPHNPFVDGEGVIRVGSRLIHADLDEEAKFPAILPKEDDIVKDLIRWQHMKDQHAG